MEGHLGTFKCLSEQVGHVRVALQASERSIACLVGWIEGFIAKQSLPDAMRTLKVQDGTSSFSKHPSSSMNAIMDAQRSTKSASCPASRHPRIAGLQNLATMM